MPSISYPRTNALAHTCFLKRAKLDLLSERFTLIEIRQFGEICSHRLDIRVTRPTEPRLFTIGSHSQMTNRLEEIETARAGNEDRPSAGSDRLLACTIGL
ncbi:hypothetical protein BA011_30190 (plasmid) [Rhizobium leguminosarum]|uniref:Uncharacterized protein n=1 Tax=Rhizobium leguminosarum TaxID=384 RepID=A0A1B1CJJ6_RHILE|nr:hypothetical protein BA011_30190 [Rhizobium leguminosarum]